MLPQRLPGLRLTDRPCVVDQDDFDENVGEFVVVDDNVDPHRLCFLRPRDPHCWPESSPFVRRFNLNRVYHYLLNLGREKKTISSIQNGFHVIMSSRKGELTVSIMFPQFSVSQAIGLTSPQWLTAT